MSERIEEKIVMLPAIESERHFVEVGAEMLGANFVPASRDAAFQERECRFNGIGVNVRSAPDVFFFPVIHFLVPMIADSLSVRRQFIGDNHVHVLGDIFFDVLCERTNFRVLGMEEAKIAVALADADDYFFVGALLPAPIFSRAMQATADIGFIHLDRSIEHLAVYLFHRRADAMAEIPSGFVADSECALDLAGGHSLFRFAEQERGEKPLVQGQVRVIENRASGDGELVVATLAVVERLFGFQFDSGHLAARALRASRPAQTGEHFAAFIISREQGVYIN